MLDRNAAINLYSFDIFDTLITRRVADPKGIFVLMRNILMKDPAYSDVSNELKENFLQHRTNAEYRQRRLHNSWKDGVDITFDQIYDDIKSTLALSEEETEKVKRLEVSLELENIIPIEANIARLKELLRQKKRVVLISDMYLPESVIHQMLAKCDPVLTEVPLYLSSTLGFMKSKAALYTFVQKKENVPFSEWVHLGDNKHADFDKAKEVGIKAERYPYVSMKAFESEVLKSYKFHEPYVQLALGCSKNVRLANQSKSPFFHLGASLGGSILYPYVSWIIKQALKRNLKRLYFIARDGYVLKLLADIIIGEEKLDIETFYIYGSRKAWRLPSLSLESQEHYAQFIETAMWTHQKIDEAFGMTREELCSFLPEELHGFAQGLKAAKCKKLKEFLLSNTALLQKAVEKASATRLSVLGYLKQAIDTSDKNFAFVDLDGSGFTQNCLSELMKDFYPFPIKSFYLACTPAIFFPLNVERFYFYSLRQPYVANYLELLTKAPHGQTLGYEQIEGIWKPVLEEQGQFTLLNDYFEGVVAYARELRAYERSNPYVCFQHLLLVDQYVGFIYGRSDTETAKLLGSVSHSFYGQEGREFAPKITFGDAMRFLFTDKLETESLHYSSQRSNKTVRRILEFKQKYPKTRKFFFDVHVSRKKKQAYVVVLGAKISFRKLLGMK